MRRAFVYCRVGTQEQSEDNHCSLALQEELIEQLLSDGSTP